MAERTTKSLGFPSFCMGDLSYVDIQQYLKHSDTILIPKASLEQHGPHLPLYCDTITATEVAQRAGEEAGILYTPTIWMGYSPQHMRSPGWGAGTITLRADTYLNMIYDVGRSLIHHGFNRLIFVNGHGSNVKVIDPVLRKLRNETGALIAYYKPYAERYIGMLKDVLEGPVEETPGWHAGELETSQCLAHNPDLVRLDRAVVDKAHSPKWLGEAWAKKDGMPDAEFQGYQYFNFPFEHEEFTDSGVMGNPHRGTAEKGEIAFSRFSQHLIDAVAELEKVDVQVKNRDFTEGKSWGW
ncbi:MAG: creatininase family protein [Chloroflexi bacterium]|uniref:creatininase family protein n=1 Tax=Candidatus Flexifilum breve TaxID=3140694 RepID=UPI003136BEA1|nr:creatininase family protein [Chloroflexota bacterium]